MKACLRSFLLALSIAAVSLTAGGCGNSSGSVHVTGVVTFQGQPVESGEIIFTPQEDGQPSAAGKIEQGKYECQVPAGPSSVRITAYRPVPGKFDTSNPGEKTPVVEMYIPAKYNDRTTLEVTVDRASPTLDFKLGSS